jgi:hypothetical protein
MGKTSACVATISGVAGRICTGQALTPTSKVAVE